MVEPSMLIRILFALPVVVAAGCSGGGSSRPDARIFGEQCQPGGSFALDGRAAVLATLNVDIDAQGLVQAPATAELVLIMDATQSGRDVAVTATLCAIEIPEVPLAGQDQPIRLSVPDATIESVGSVAGAASLSSPNETCATFETEQFTIVIGARLDPIETAILPQADEDGAFRACAPSADTRCDLAIGVNCACDQEGDGHGGATLNISGVPLVDLDRVYATMRTKFTLRGEVFSSDLILGEIDASIEQGILGCHVTNADDCSPDQVGTVKTLNPTISQQLGNPSRFRAVRVEDTMSCAEVLAQKDELFPR
ncbi:MAG TPA: hypothetical protein VML75_11560 [Kofleriaceae bacterium]|nr:hypothetical protein [Kofleriaceae bacterium]